MKVEFTNLDRARLIIDRIGELMGELEELDIHADLVRDGHKEQSRSGEPGGKRGRDIAKSRILFLSKYLEEHADDLTRDLNEMLIPDGRRFVITYDLVNSPQIVGVEKDYFLTDRRPSDLR